MNNMPREPGAPYGLPAVSAGDRASTRNPGPSGPRGFKIAALAGGVGAARLLRGLVRVASAEDITVVINTGDDATVHRLHVCPDIDTVIYTLAGVSDPDRGWGLASETWNALTSLERYGADTWFRLGDRDLGTHLYRTERIAAGAPLSTITREIASAWEIGARLLPMTDDRVETRLTLFDDSEVSFQEYFVRMKNSVPVKAIEFAGATQATPGPGVIDGLNAADVVIVCPSNPLLSVAPILSIPGIRASLERRRESVVAVSPIVGGRALRGPADHLMAELGHEPSAAGVAKIYASIASILVIDDQDAELAAEVAKAGMHCVVTGTIMDTLDASEALASAVLETVQSPTSITAGPRGTPPGNRGPSVTADLPHGRR